MILLISISQIPIITIALVSFFLFVAFRIRHLVQKRQSRRTTTGSGNAGPISPLPVI